MRMSETKAASMTRKNLSLFDSKLIGPAIVDSFKKLNPRAQLRSPVMFVVYVGSIITTLLFIPVDQRAGRSQPGLHTRCIGMVVVHCIVCQLCRIAGRRSQ